MKKTPLSNPAGRLFAVLTAAKAKGEDTQTSKVWGEILDAQGDEALILERLAMLRRQYELLRSLIASEDGLNSDFYSGQLAAVPTIIHPVHLQGAWSGVKQRLSEGVLLSLSFCSDWLERGQSEREVDSGEIAEIQKLVEDLVHFVLEAEQDYPFRKTLLAALEKIRASLVEYRFRGAQALEDALQLTVGAVVLRKTELRESDGERAADEISRLEKIVGRLHVIVGFAKNLGQIAAPVIRALLE